MNRSRIRRYRLVVGVDLTDYSEIVIEQALDQAARHQAPEIHFLHVSEKRKQDFAELNDRLSAAVYPALQVFNQYGTDWRARLHVRRGKPDQQLAILAADVNADMIVMGQFGLHRKGLPKRVISHAPCATLVVQMPKQHDSTQCCACSATREESDGVIWFCDDHVVADVVSPLSVWSNGRGAYMQG
jgi:nucleotide-binding universal stress UspA family protein